MTNHEGSRWLAIYHTLLTNHPRGHLQINFFDHTKLLLAADAEVVTYINRDRVMVTHTLQALLARNETDIISRLKYAREILAKLTGVVGSGGVSDTAAGPSGSSLATAGPSPRR